MTDRIVGKVARINSDRELIINRGSEHGVEEGLIFRVKGAPIDITDPDSGASLGTVSSVKLFVRAEEVDGKFCIARTFRTKRVNVGGYGGIGSLSGILQPPKYETRVETLRRGRYAGEPISEEESLVEVGDLVESLADGEEVDADITTTLWR